MATDKEISLPEATAVSVDAPVPRRPPTPAQPVRVTRRMDAAPPGEPITAAPSPSAIPTSSRQPPSPEGRSPDPPDEQSSSTVIESPALPLPAAKPRAAARRPSRPSAGWSVVLGLAGAALGFAAYVTVESARTSPATAVREAAPAPPSTSPSAVKAPAASERYGRLTLDTSPPTEVYLDTERLGATPLVEVRLPVGRQHLRALNTDARIDHVIEVEILPERTTIQKISW